MLNVLLVDDNYEYLEFLFNELGEKINSRLKIVKICSDGEKALNYIMNTKIDIILLDLNIPKISGIEILQKIKENNIDSDVIVITGEPNFLIEMINKNLPVKKSLLKPFDLPDLTEALNDIVNEKIYNPKANREKLISILDNFNFNKTNMGFNYIVDCLNVCIDKNYYFIPKMNTLYKYLLEDKNYTKLSTSIINWNISKAIQSMNKLTDEEILRKYFPYDTPPSPKSFLNGILNIYYTYK